VRRESKKNESKGKRKRRVSRFFWRGRTRLKTDGKEESNRGAVGQKKKKRKGLMSSGPTKSAHSVLRKGKYFTPPTKRGNESMGEKALGPLRSLIANKRRSSFVKIKPVLRGYDYLEYSLYRNTKKRGFYRRGGVREDKEEWLQMERRRACCSGGQDLTPHQARKVSKNENPEAVSTGENQRIGR